MPFQMLPFRKYKRLESIVLVFVLVGDTESEQLESIDKSMKLMLGVVLDAHTLVGRGIEEAELAVLRMPPRELGAHKLAILEKADHAVLRMPPRVLDAHELAFLVEKADLAVLRMPPRVLEAHELAVL